MVFPSLRLICAVHSYAHIKTFGACLDFFFFWIKLTLLRRLFLTTDNLDGRFFILRYFFDISLHSKHFFYFIFPIHFLKLNWKIFRKNVRKPICSEENLKRDLKNFRYCTNILVISKWTFLFTIFFEHTRVSFKSNRLRIFPNLCNFLPYLCLNNNNLYHLLMNAARMKFFFKYVFCFLNSSLMCLISFPPCWEWRGLEVRVWKKDDWRWCQFPYLWGNFQNNWNENVFRNCDGFTSWQDWFTADCFHRSFASCYALNHRLNDFLRLL